MKEFPKDIKFKYSWRKYQQRVLNELENHLSDDHLHIIAPPGSGKTILGLEVAIRLNKPTLILAPTIAIRNQWIQRFCELFLQESITPDWISRDIRNPKFITVATYQGLHAACNNLRIKKKENEEDIEDIEEEIPTNLELENIVKKLKVQKVKTIVVDEAHHLKNEWWQTLTKVKEGIKPIIVGLTATPPYDVSITEWQRYLELNGPVDAEISVPELVIEGDLCPHQDYIHFTLPTEKENQNIREFRENIERLFSEIKQDDTLVKAIENHPIWLNPTNQLDWIYTNLPYYSACLIFLNANQKEIPITHLEIIGDKNLTIPKLDYNWIETILDFYLYKEKEHFTQFEEHKKNLENRLRRYGAIEKKKINFSHNKKVTGFLTSSISKLNGIKEIVDFEYTQFGKDLRMVILSDYIRKEFFVNTSENNIELNKIGIIPIFEKLRRQNIDHKKIGVLTGSIIIIPKSAFTIFQTKALELGITKINSSTVPYDANYIRINQSEQLKNDIINIVTQIFQIGEIEVLIGTKSLLGEGWDAPAINSLILASFVGSFVLSNQMRGRAIRTQNGNINKTGNIWHLVTIDQTSTTGGDDFELLKRRFRGFVGVSFKENAGIENGTNRLNLPENIYLKEEAEKKNKEMFSYAANRESLKQRWEVALKSGVTLVEEIKIPFKEEKEYKAIKSLYFYKTIGNLLATLGSGLVGFGIESLQGLGRAAKNIRSTKDLYFYLAIIGATGVAIFGRFTLKTLRLYFKYRDISKDIQQIGNALLNSLIKAGIIHTNNSNLRVKTTIDEWGSVFCHLEGGTTFEKSTFVNSLKEIINPIDNPRYVIIRKNMFMMFLQQKDYHSVPEILGKNKKLAEFFKNQWQRLVGNCELIFTRTIDGRKALLKSRVKSLSSQFEEKAEHVNKWR
ncbi:DEAD/DEAH box helicase [Formosa sediminum]|uniref:DEAD/DEAH box helicase n=1 Tax=Formosa sediminum TaxID=2594004 RepID=A0A516GTC7_9FLAO|nr:DEAD/DEAH box helicase family protein [Formosa sediminum]QDO94630.1 DEAD/DEAH box helicase [Formosa sediminum]